MNYRKKAMLMAGALLCLNLSIYSQSISLKMSNVSVKKAMTELQTKSGYSFVYIAGDVDTDRTVSINASQLKDAVAQILKGQNVSYEIQGKNIVIKKGSQQQVTSGKRKKVTGTVKDANGEPIIGATVVEKGTTNGTVTDFDGNYTLELSESGTLAVSYIGYKSQEFAASRIKSGSLTVTLKEDTEVMDEIVVVGFGTQKKVNLTGSVGIATAKEIESRPVTSATQALQGLVPGLQISTNTGEMNQNMSVSIRGQGTIGDGSSGSPLILIDGMEGDLNTINPQDIENISVLKDAAASSIYGSRAPFGVILVTTKTGKEGKVSVNYNNNFRISSPMNLPESMDSYSFAVMLNQAQINSGTSQYFSDDVMRKMIAYQEGKLSGGLDPSPNNPNAWDDVWSTGYANTDLYDEYYKKNVFSQEHNLSISGGSDKMSYYVSANYMNQKGLLKFGDDGIRRYNITGKINAKLTKWLAFNFSTRFTHNDVWNPSAGMGYNYFGRQNWPNLPIYDSNGYLYQSKARDMEYGGLSDKKGYRNYYQGAFIIEPIKRWITKVELNYSIFDEDEKSVSIPTYKHLPDGSLNTGTTSSSLYQSDKKEKYLNLNVYSEYSHTFNEMHNAKIMLGFQSEEMERNFFSVKKYGLLISGMPEFDLTNGLGGDNKPVDPAISGYSNEWATVGFFGRLNYDYNGRYLFEANMRYDGSSRFRRGSRWVLSPSFSLGWNIAQENFWSSIADVVNLLKFRVSYGELSNQNTDNWYPTYRSMDVESLAGKWLALNGTAPNIASIGDLVSTSLTWETVRSWNIGFDFGLFNNRLTGSFDYYKRSTLNMVGPSPELPPTLGISSPKTNNTDLSTKGWELSLGWKDRINNGLSYSVNLSLSNSNTYINRYPGNLTNSIGENGSTGSYVAGQKIGQIWGFETIGIAKSQEEMDKHLSSLPNGGQNALGTQWMAGDIMYRDLNGDGKISEGARTLDDHGDLKVLGDASPHYFIGLDLTADWKGFDIRCFWQGVLKHDFWPGGDSSGNNEGGGGYFWGVRGNKSMWHIRGFKQHEDYFRSEPIGLEGHEISANLDAYFPRPLVSLSGSANGKNQYVQSRYMQNARYIRLKNLQIGYTLPTAWTSKVGVSKCRFFVSGENLLTFSPIFSVFDPETCSGGVGGNAYPLSRTWSFGVNITL